MWLASIYRNFVHLKSLVAFVLENIHFITNAQFSVCRLGYGCVAFALAVEQEICVLWCSVFHSFWLTCSSNTFCVTTWYYIYVDIHN